MIPLCLVTGFLGSGKTTFLKHVINANRDRRLVYLINEFSKLDVDAALLERESDQVVSIPGGSIFCTCLVTEFIAMLRRVDEVISTTDTPVEGVVVEASGMANPKVAGDMLRETKLDQVFDLAQIVSIVDPGSFMKLLKTLPNIVDQVEAADVVLLNKTDVYTDAQVAETRSALLDIKPNVRIVPTTYGTVDLDLFGAPSGARELSGEYAKCRDPNYDTVAVTFEAPADVDAIKTLIQTHADEIYRVKGTVPCADGSLLLDYSGSGLTLTPRKPGTADGLVFIFRGDTSPALRDGLSALTTRGQ